MITATDLKRRVEVKHTLAPFETHLFDFFREGLQIGSARAEFSSGIKEHPFVDLQKPHFRVVGYEGMDADCVAALENVAKKNASGILAFDLDGGLFSGYLKLGPVRGELAYQFFKNL